VRIAEKKCSGGRLERRCGLFQANSAPTPTRKASEQQERERRAAEQDEDAAHGGSERARQVEADAVERNRLHQVLARHDFRHGRCPGRLIHRRADADRERQYDEPGRVDGLSIGQHHQRGRGQHGPDLHADHEPPPVDRVGNRAGRQGEQERRDDGGCLHQTHAQRVRR